MQRELVALARPLARVPPSLVAWDLGPVVAWVGPMQRVPECLVERAVALGQAHLESPVLPFRAGGLVHTPEALRVTLGDLAEWCRRLDALAGLVELGVHWPRPALPTVNVPSGRGAAWLSGRRVAHAPELAGDRARTMLTEALGASWHQSRVLGTDERTVRMAVLLNASNCVRVRSELAVYATAVTGPWAPASFVNDTRRLAFGRP